MQIHIYIYVYNFIMIFIYILDSKIITKTTKTIASCIRNSTNDNHNSQTSRFLLEAAKAKFTIKFAQKAINDFEDLGIFFVICLLIGRDGNA